MGFVRPSAGEVRICGLPVARRSSSNIVAYVPQSEDVDWNFPVLVEDVVMMGRYGHMNFLRIPRATDRRKVDAALERVGMSDYRERQIGELTGGQKKRVFLARALAQEGRIILLDEPFTGVDVKTETAIIDLLRELRDAGHLMLVSTHNLGSVPEFCDQVVLINRTVLAAGPTARGLHRRRISSAPSAACCAISSSAAARCTTTTIARSVTVLTDDERPLVFYGDKPSRAKDENGARRRTARNDRAELLVPFGYDYMLKAMWVSALVGGVCAFLSSYLMLKGWSLMGDALAHAVVPGVAGRLHPRRAVRRRRLLRRPPRRARHGLRQAANAAARGCRHRPRLHHLLRARAADGLDLPDLGQRSRPSCSAISSPSPTRTSCRWSIIAAVTLAVLALQLEGPDATFFDANQARTHRAQHRRCSRSCSSRCSPPAPWRRCRRSAPASSSPWW